MSARDERGNDRPPNVVLFISDRQHHRSLDDSAQQRPRTPHLDRLAADGTRFNRAYCTTPLCTPARTSIFTGLYPHAHGMVANHQPRPGADLLRYRESLRNLGHHLGDLGYESAYSGKWHLGSGGRRPGFDHVLQRGNDYDVDSPEENDVLRLANRLGIRLGGKHNGFEVRAEHHEPEINVGTPLLEMAELHSYVAMDRAVSWLRARSADPERRERPFLLVFSCKEPHPPFGAPQPFHTLYDPASVPLPPTRHDAAGLELKRLRDEPFLRQQIEGLSDSQLRRVYAAFWGSVTYVDHLFGRLQTALHETDELDRSLVVYTSDHGEMLGNHGIFGQFGMLYEDVARIPLIVRPPGGLGRGNICEQLVSHVDLTPTIVSYCGGEAVPGLHGRDAGALVAGGDEPIHDGVGVEYHSANWTSTVYPMRAWVTDTSKLILTQDGTDQLYDLEADPDELTNLAADPAATELRDSLEQSLGTWQQATGDQWPTVVQPPPGYGPGPAA